MQNLNSKNQSLVDEFLAADDDIDDQEESKKAQRFSAKSASARFFEDLGWYKRRP